MVSIFNHLCEGNKENLLRWRARYSKKEYPYKVVLNMFYDMIPAYHLWLENHSDFGQKLFSNQNESYKYVYSMYREIQLRYAHSMNQIMSDGIQIGKRSSKDYDSIISLAQSGSNKDVEELEYAYIVFVSTSIAIQYWFTIGYLGNDEVKSAQMLFPIQFMPDYWGDFSAVFGCFQLSVATIVGGTDEKIGQIQFDKLYKPLPDLWT